MGKLRPAKGFSQDANAGEGEDYFSLGPDEEIFFTQVFFWGTDPDIHLDISSAEGVSGWRSVALPNLTTKYK